MPDNGFDLQDDLRRVLATRAAAVRSDITPADVRGFARPRTFVAPALAAAAMVVVAGGGLAVASVARPDHAVAPVRSVPADAATSDAVAAANCHAHAVLYTGPPPSGWHSGSVKDGVVLHSGPPLVLPPRLPGLTYIVCSP